MTESGFESNIIKTNFRCEQIYVEQTFCRVLEEKVSGLIF